VLVRPWPPVNASGPTLQRENPNTATRAHLDQLASEFRRYIAQSYNAAPEVSLYYPLPSQQAFEQWLAEQRAADQRFGLRSVQTEWRPHE
jgi:hypothetical protein